jgi:hypothetical protein
MWLEIQLVASGQDELILPAVALRRGDAPAPSVSAGGPLPDFAGENFANL